MALLIFTIPACAGSANIAINLVTDQKTYGSGEPIAMALTVVNQNSQPYQAIFSSGKKYDFILRDSSGKTVWQWSGGKMFTQAFTKVDLEPGTPRTCVAVFNPAPPEGKNLKPGSYTLTGVFITAEKQFESEPVEIAIR